MVSLQTSSCALTEAEHARLYELEWIVQEGLEGFLKTGAALAEIRDQRLYRSTHDRFEDYCLDRWGLSLSRCNQIIQTTATYDHLLASVPQDAELLAEANEHTLRPLNRLEPELQTVTWELIRRIEERPAGITVQTVVTRIKEAIDDGWEERAPTDTDSQMSDPAGHTGSAAPARARRSRRMPERKSDELGNLCRWAQRLANWDPEVIAASDDVLCLVRHLKAARQLRSFCEMLIHAIEARLPRTPTYGHTIA